jgi:4-hydroxy-tetrahydrodipicolinate synthase
MDQLGRYGGPCRPPRGPLTDEQRAQVTSDMERAIAALEKRRAAR